MGAMSNFCGDCGTSIDAPRFCSGCGLLIGTHVVRGGDLTPRSSKSHEPTFVSLRDAAFRLSVSEKTVRTWIARGELPAYRHGIRIIRVKVDDLDATMRQIPTWQG